MSKKPFSDSQRKVMQLMGVNPDKPSRKVDKSKRWLRFKFLFAKQKKEVMKRKVSAILFGTLGLSIAFLLYQLVQVGFFGFITSRYGIVTPFVFLLNGAFIYWLAGRYHPTAIIPLMNFFTINLGILVPATVVGSVMMRDVSYGGMIAYKLFSLIPSAIYSQEIQTALVIGGTIVISASFVSVGYVFRDLKRLVRNKFFANTAPFKPMPDLQKLDDSSFVDTTPNVPVQEQTSLVESYANLGFSGIKHVNTSNSAVFKIVELKLPNDMKTDAVGKQTDNLSNQLGIDNISFMPVVVGKPKHVKILIEHDKETRKSNAHLYDYHNLMDSQAVLAKANKMELPALVGLGISGKPLVIDIAKEKHILIGGASGGGKSKGVEAMLLSLLTFVPDSDLEMVIIDPKRTEMVAFNSVPHLRGSSTVTEPFQAQEILESLVLEMGERYKLMGNASKQYNTAVKNIKSYNQLVKSKRLDRGEGSTFRKMKYIVVQIDEYAELKSADSLDDRVDVKQIDTMVVRLAQMGRAAGMHVILATQKPTVQVVDTVVKGNLSCRIAFSTNTGKESDVILDQYGAENLIGLGDLLLLSEGEKRPERAQGAFIPDELVYPEIESIKNLHGVNPLPE